jgi:hypothetical protein
MQTINDVRNGCLVCSDCGFIQSNELYLEEFYNINEKSKNIQEKINTIYVHEIISRLNLPDTYANLIQDEIKRNKLKISSKNLNDILYTNLNKDDIAISLREIDTVSQQKKYKRKKKKESEVVIFKIENCLEKYCKLLNLTYRDYTVIKEKILKIPKTGHNPLTIIASTIYKYSKEKKKKLSMKKISQMLNINSISIQRYLKK